MPKFSVKAAAVVAAAAIGAGAAHATTPPAWQPLGLGTLHVTEGSVTSSGGVLATRSAAMRATADDGGVHAASARIAFSYLGESTTTSPLGSGEVRRQIGLKLRSADPCNLVYVMWHVFPSRLLEVSVKRNPGQTTSAQCANRGYTKVADIPLGTGDGTADHSEHLLEVRTRRLSSGALAVSLYTDHALLQRLNVPAALSAGLDGPVGVRSDNGSFSFRLWSR